MECTYNGWPYLFVVSLHGGIKAGDELLIDYDAKQYWANRELLEYENNGLLKLLKSQSMDVARTHLELVLKDRKQSHRSGKRKAAVVLD